MREKNQQIVQNDIYEVYKFMEKQDKQKGDLPKKISPPKKQMKNDPKPVKARPVSSIPRTKPK